MNALIFLNKNWVEPIWGAAKVWVNLALLMRNNESLPEIASFETIFLL